MYEIASLLHYSLLALIVILPALAVALGQARAGFSIIDAIDTQPRASKESLTAFLWGATMNETAAIGTTIIGMMLLIKTSHFSLAQSIAEMGIFLGLVVPASLVGYLSSYAHCEAVQAVARQPFTASKITNLMIIAISMMQLSVILGLIIAFVMYFKLAVAVTIGQAWQLVAAGFAFGGGAIGPLLGMSHFTRTACRTVGRYPQAYGAVLSTSFVSQALIETPILFSLGVSLFILVRATIDPLVALAAALTMVLCTVGPGIASGRIASSACEGIGMRPEKVSVFSYTSMIGQTLIDASAIYGVVVVALLLFASK